MILMKKIIKVKNLLIKAIIINTKIKTIKVHSQIIIKKLIEVKSL